MAFIVQKKYFNGYRCDCCRSSWENTELVDTLEEALEHIPRENTGEGEHVVLQEVEVRDGATGDLEGWGMLQWPRAGRGSYYTATRWVGSVQGERFDSHSDEEWKALTREEDRKQYEMKLRQAESALKKAQQEVAHYQKVLKELGD